MIRLLPGFLATLLALGLSLWARPRLPAQVATHWGLDGSPDGWSSAAVAAFGLPGFMLLLAGVFLLLPRLDPLQRAYTERSSPYWLIANVVLAFTAILHAAVLAFALGWPVRVATVAPVGVGVLFILIGVLMHRMPPSWFMGIRTPWTLSSDVVWRKTHQLGGVCFAVAGLLLVVAGLVRPEGLLVTLMIVAGVAAAVPVAYSYVAWKEELGRRNP
jgi:uncharacterized membrane protein